MTKIQKKQTTPNLMRTWNKRNAHSFLVGMQTGTATLEDNLTVSDKVKQFSHMIGIALLGIYPTDLKPYVHTKTYT